MGEWVSTFISIGAVLIAAAAFWRAHLRPFKANVVLGMPELRLFPISLDDGEDVPDWHIASIMLHVSLVNVGARPGRIVDMRVTFDEINEDSERKPRFTMYPMFIVDPTEIQHCGSDREEFLTKAIVSHWKPILLNPREVVSTCIALETRWDEIPIGLFDIAIQIFPDDKRQKWETHYNWYLPLSREMQEDLEAGSSFVLPSHGEGKRRSDRPQDQ